MNKKAFNGFNGLHFTIRFH